MGLFEPRLSYNIQTLAEPFNRFHSKILVFGPMTGCCSLETVSFARGHWMELVTRFVADPVAIGLLFTLIAFMAFIDNVDSFLVRVVPLAAEYLATTLPNSRNNVIWIRRGIFTKPTLRVSFANQRR